MLAYIFLIEIFQATVSRIMKKYHNKYDSRLGYGELTVIFALYSRFKFIFCHCGIKKLAKIILYTKLFYKFVHAIIIAIIVRKYL